MERDSKVEQVKKINETEELQECSFTPRIEHSIDRFWDYQNKINLFDKLGVEEHIER